jgi:hypothetical protein
MTMTETTQDLAAKIDAIWAQFDKDMKWAVAARKRGDTLRYELGSRTAWRTADAALKALAAPPPPPRYKPELKLICGEHPVFVPPPPPPANDVCLTCDGTGTLPNGTACQFCQPRAERPSIVTDAEEPTAVEGATLVELPVVAETWPTPANPDVAALEASVNLDWALQDGRTLDAYDAALARIDAELARVAVAKSAGARR